MDKTDERKELLRRAQKNCSEREYCISDIRSLLVRWGAVDEETKEWIISKLQEDKFIDEERYCRAFAIDHFRHSQWGRMKIIMSLRHKNIASAAIASGLEAIEEKEYIDLLKKIITDHRRKIKAKNRIDLKGKLLRYALGKGFESHLVYDIINSEIGD
jgi:regulatory protein